MRRVNRSAIIVMPKQPFVDWLNGVDEERAEVTLSDICDDFSCYLIPEVLSRREQKEYLEQNHGRMFEKELQEWYPDRKVWPDDRNFKRFLDWFSVSFHSTVYDDAGYEIVGLRDRD